MPTESYSEGRAGCRGLLTEALVEGRLIEVERHSTVIEFYGVVEEAEAYLGRARVLLAPLYAERVRLLQKAVRLIGGVLAGYIKPGDVEDLLNRAAEGLDEPRGWSLSGCDEPESLLALASVKLRAAERLASRMHSEGLVSRSTTESLIALLSRIAYITFMIRVSLCRRAKLPEARSLALLA